MPTYDFKCKSCEKVFSVICRISERGNQKCPECASSEYEAHFEETPSFGDPVRLGVRTIDNGFREVLSKINQNNYKSNLKGKLSRS